MYDEQIKDRCPSASYIAKGFLKDYKICFTRFSGKWKSAVADITTHSGHCVWGVLYQISKADLIRLDSFEGHPNAYVRKSFKVYQIVDNYRFIDNELVSSENSLLVDAEAYEVVNITDGLFPKIEYLRILLDAAFERNLPIKYQEELRSFGMNDYDNRLRVIIDRILVLEDILRIEAFPPEKNTQDEWGGAELVVTGDLLRKEQLNRDYPNDIAIFSPHWRELSWLIKTIYRDETFNWQIDSCNKHEILKTFGLAAKSYQQKNPNDKSSKGICLAVLSSAYKLFTIDFYKQI
jgi:hypothetical protein